MNDNNPFQGLTISDDNIDSDPFLDSVLEPVEIRDWVQSARLLQSIAISVRDNEMSRDDKESRSWSLFRLVGQMLEVAADTEAVDGKLNVPLSALCLVQLNLFLMAVEVMRDGITSTTMGFEDFRDALVVSMKKNEKIFTTEMGWPDYDSVGLHA